MTERLGQEFERTTLSGQAGKTALTIIDFTDSYTRPDLPAGSGIDYDYRVAGTGISMLCEAVRRHAPHIPIIWVADATIHPASAELLRENNSERIVTLSQYETVKNLLQEMRRDDVVPHFYPLSPAPADAVFVKATNNVFQDSWHVDHKTSFANHLKSEGIDNLWLCGTAIPSCLREAAITSAEYGIKSSCIKRCSAGGMGMYDQTEYDLLWDEGMNFQAPEDIFREIGAPVEPFERAMAEVERLRPLPPQRPGLLQKMAGILKKTGPS